MTLFSKHDVIQILFKEGKPAKEEYLDNASELPDLARLPH